jgi:arylsulfatase A-like enzyme
MSTRFPLALALPVLLFAELLLCAVLSQPYELDAATLLYLALIYALFTTLLNSAARFAHGVARPLGALASIGLAFCVTAQLRLDAEVLTGTWGFVLATGAIAAVFGVLLWKSVTPAEGPPPRRELALPYAALGLLVLAVWGGVELREGWHWQLLHHQRLLGHPLYYLRSPTIVGERDRLWNRRPRPSDPWEFADQVVRERPAPAADAPHVVFLLVDTLRADALAHYGGERDWMPVTNELAGRSFVFSNMRANASWTRASCASIFTGLLPEEHGAARFHERLSERWTTMPELMQGAGYQTAAFVTNWVQVGKSTGFSQGFDVFRELASAEEVMASGREEIRDQYARAGRLNDAVLQWLAGEERGLGAARGDPLFLYMHYLDPHAPYLAGAEEGNGDDPRERKRGLYRQELRYFDAELGKFLARLEELLPGPCAIVLTSDHGEEFWEHGEWGHGHSLYRELTWVPAFVHMTARAKGGASAAPLESRDLFDLVAQLPRGAEFDPAAWAESRARSSRYASQYLDRVADVRPDKKWTGLRLYEENGRELIWSAYGPSLQLYDLEADPLEQSNRIDLDPELRARLLLGLDRAVRFWSRSPRVERTADDLEFLRQLGYAGGVDRP